MKKKIKKDILFEIPRVSPGDQPLTKKPEDSGTRLILGGLLGADQKDGGLWERDWHSTALSFGVSAMSGEESLLAHSDKCKRKVMK